MVFPDVVGRLWACWLALVARLWRHGWLQALRDVRSPSGVQPRNWCVRRLQVRGAKTPLFALGKVLRLEKRQ